MSAHIMHTALTRSVPVPEEQPGTPYLEIEAAYAVHNRYLRIALACACVTIVAMAAAGWKLSRAYADVRPLVIRVNEAGDAVAAPYASLAYQPREPEVRHFLMRFVQDHYSRVRATARDAFQRKLFFLGSALARAAMEEESRSKSLQSFLVGSDDEVEIYVTNVAIEDLRQAPYKASVDFEKVYRAAGDGRELKREKYTAHFVFTLLDRVPNNFIEVNPLGLVITYFREDQAF
jgi:type IV secretory pathway TrbF-like protein